MKRLVLAFSLLAAPAWSAPIKVISGEHKDFTRLVFEISPRTKWAMVPNKDGFVLELTGTKSAFDTSKTFLRISRNRIVDIEDLGNGRAQVYLDCDCGQSSFRTVEGMLVIDVSGAPGTGRYSPDTNNPDDSKSPDTSSPDSSNPGTKSIDAPQLVTPKSRPKPEAAPQLFAEAPKLPRAPVALPGALTTTRAEPDQNPVPKASIDGLETQFLQSIGRAATQGYLTLRPGGYERTQIEKSDHDARPTATDVSVAMEDVDVMALQAPGMIDRTALDQPAQKPIKRGAKSCVPVKWLHPDGWQNDSSFSYQIGEKRRALVDKKDARLDAALKDLAHTYISFGFGLEARQVLLSDEMTSREESVLLEMADLVDDMDRPANMLAQQMGCSDVSNLWAFLAAPSEELLISEHRAMVQAFMLFPQGLQDRLRGRFLQSLVETGDEESASILLAREPEDPNDFDTEMVRAELASPTEDLASDPVHQDTLLGLAHRTPEQIIALIRRTLGEGELPDPDVLGLAETMLYENRGATVGRSLQEVVFQARIASHEFETAHAILSGPLHDMKPSHPLRTMYMDAITEHADDERFLVDSFDLNPYAFRSVTRRAVSKRLKKLGFADMSQIWHPDAAGANHTPAQNAPQTVEPAGTSPELSIDTPPELHSTAPKIHQAVAKVDEPSLAQARALVEATQSRRDRFDALLSDGSDN